MIQAHGSYIARNQISHNNDGIVCVQSSATIVDNTIKFSANNGLTLMENSHIKIEKNSIQDNYGIGLYLRDKSFGDIKDNKVHFLLFSYSIMRWI